MVVAMALGWAGAAFAGAPLDDGFFSSPLAAASAPAQARDAWKALEAGNDVRARRLLSAFISDSPGHSLAPQAQFLLGHLEAEAGEHGSASEHFERAGNRLDLLQNHAFWFGAEAAYDAGDYDRAIRLCRAIPAGDSHGVASTVLRGRALMAKGQLQAAIDVFEGVAKAHPKASTGQDARLFLGLALEKRKRWVEAGRVLHSVRVSEPGSWRERIAKEALGRVEKRLSKADRNFLRRRTAAQRIERAEALNKKHRSEQVIDEIGAWLESRSAPKKGSKAWCDAKYLQGTARRKLRSHTAASRSFEAFLASCKRHPMTLKVLFSGGRSAWTAGQNDRALRWFTRVWKEYPNHSYADDAVLYAARIHESAGRGAASRKLLALQIQKFPKGDMLADAHWRLFSRDFKAKRYARAVRYVDGLERTGENTLYTRGRLHYFRARALELQGKKKAAAKGFESLLTHAPMSYYSLLGLGRLQGLDPAAYRRAVARFSVKDAAPTRWTVEPADLGSDRTFLRGVALLRLGMQAEAGQEFRRLRRQRAGDDRVLWTLTVLFDRVGAFHLSHDIPRREIAGFGQAWPIGQERGRYEVAYPRPHLESVRKWSKARGIPEELVYAIMREESGFNERIESWAGAMGLMQLMLPTAKGVSKAAGVTHVNRGKLLEANTNIQLGTQFLANLMAGYGGHPAVTIAGYNGGFGNVDRWLAERGKLPLDLWVEEIPFGQTRHYTKRVLTTMWTYRWLYGRDEARVMAVSQKLPRPTNR